MSFELFDDKSPQVLPFILTPLQSHTASSPNTPFFIGLNGVQGAGKTVLVSTLQRTLSSPPHNLNTCVFSLDDLYLTHENQVALAHANPQNPLLQHRGQPGTHDVRLAREIFASLKENKPTKIPKYNKALFSGQGDRQPESEWDTVNVDPKNPVRIVLFEGWSVGFQPLSTGELKSKHDAAVTELKSENKVYEGRLGHNTLASVTTINESLREYAKLWSYFDVFIHIDAFDPLFVYQWRLEQEATTKRERGSGMTDDEVKRFVDGYYPSYELYTETLRKGIFRLMSSDEENEAQQGKQLRLVVGADRKVRDVIKI